VILRATRAAAALALLVGCSAPTPTVDAAVAADSPAIDAAVDAPAVDVPVKLPPRRTLPPSPRALADLAGFSLPGRDLPLGSSPAARGRRAWALRALRALGVHRVRREIFWREVEPSEGRFTWGEYDALVDECRAAGVDVLAVLAYGNRWASSAPNATDYHAPDDPRTFARYAGAAVERYRDRVRDWEVWNEPNAGFRFWLPTVRGDAPAFGRLVSLAQESAVAADPMARVAFGGTVFLPQLIPGGVAFTRESFAANPSLAPALGAFAMHAYTLYPPRAAPESERDGEVSHVHKVEEMAAQLHASGFDLARPIWITETGWPVTADVPEERQARYLVRVVLLSALAGVDGVWLYELGDGAGRGELVPEDLFGVFAYDADTADDVDPEPKRSATALRALFSSLGAFHVTGRVRVDGAPDDAHVLSLADAAGRRAWAAWRADDDAPPWRWSPSPEATEIVDMVGAPVPRDAGAVLVGGAPVYAIAR
jgi:polysaccharide biosynthesis protein PslG